MKKLVVLILFLLIASAAFSQTDTPASNLEAEIQRLIIKDLIRGDGCSLELQLTLDKLLKVETREFEKDKIIDLLEGAQENSNLIISLQKEQLSTSGDLSKSLEKDTKKLKKKIVLWKTVSIGAVVVGLLLAI